MFIVKKVCSSRAFWHGFLRPNKADLTRHCESPSSSLRALAKQSIKFGGFSGILQQGHGASVAIPVKTKLLSCLGLFNGPLMQNPFASSVKFGCSVIARTNGTKQSIKSAAFSLVEMLMALLVASLLLAALAPVITKRAGIENINVSGSMGSSIPVDDAMCFTYTADNGGTIPDVPVPRHTIPYIVLAAGGGGGGAAIQPTGTTGHYNMPITDTATMPANGLTITRDMSNFDIEFMTGGGGGGGSGGALYDGAVVIPKSQTDCTNFGLGKTDTTGHTGTASNPILIYDEGNKNFCITKYNQKTDIVSGSGGYHIRCVNYSGGNFSGPICTQPAGVQACSELNSKFGIAIGGFGLQTRDQLFRWTENMRMSTLNLCNYEKEYYPYCPGNSKSGTGTGSEAGYYYLPAWVVSSTLHYNIDDSCTDKINASSLAMIGKSQGSATYCIHSSAYYFYYSIRCAIGGIDVYTSLSGGGGSAAPALKSSTFKNSAEYTELNTFIANNIGGKIILTAGEGGDGADAVTNGELKKDGKPGTAGKESCITVKSIAGATVYKLCVPGGNPGGGADANTSTPTGGAGGAQVASNGACYKQYSDGGAKTTFNCTVSGAPGTTGGASTSLNPANSGNGGASALDTSTVATVTGTSVIGTTLDQSGYPGAGGAGGRAYYNKDGSNNAAKFTYGKGGKGTGGMIKLTYTSNPDGGGGGGGGAGGIAHFKLGAINADNVTCSFTIGRGGNGGVASSGNKNGTDGTDTTAVCSHFPSQRYIVTGGKGGQGGLDPRTVTGNHGAKGGDGGTFNDTIENAQEVVALRKGAEGGYGAAADVYEGNVTAGYFSAGGIGGSSAATVGKCGAFYTHSDDKVCKWDAATAPGPADIHGKGFTDNDGNAIAAKPASGFGSDSFSFGEASAGGGGGGWYVGSGSGKGPGNGGRGQDGYACIYWISLEK